MVILGGQSSEGGFRKPSSGGSQRKAGGDPGSPADPFAAFPLTTDERRAQTISFRALSGSALTTLRAGLAGYICICLVKGLMRCPAFVDGL